MCCFISKSVLGVSSSIVVVSSFGAVTANASGEYEIIKGELEMLENIIDACASLGENFDNLESQKKVKDLFAKYHDLYCDLSCGRGYHMGVDIFDTLNKYKDLDEYFNNIYEVQVPKKLWWARLELGPIDSLRQTNSQKKARDFIINLDKKGPKATDLNLWYDTPLTAFWRWLHSIFY